MLVVGVDLGFPHLVLVVVLLLFVPVISFIVRRKWRHAEARREEIKRLLILASEETARAELEAEATVGYSFSSVPVDVPTPSPVAAGSAGSAGSIKPTYQCAVCFSPTTTRCSKCKAVRYCSGKCQIIHWRQGHRDECHPFVNVHNHDEVGESFSPNIFIQEVNDIYETEDVQRAKPSERHFENSFPSRSSNLESRHQKDDAAGYEYPCNEKAGDSTFRSTTLHSPYKGSSASSVCSDSSVDASVSTSSGSESSGGFISVDVPSDDSGFSTFSDPPNLVNHEDSFIGSGNRNNCGHNQPRKLSAASLDCSIKPKHSSADIFWEGTIHSRRYKSDLPDDAGLFSSTKATDENITDSQSPLRNSPNHARSGTNSLNVEGYNINSIKSHVAVPTSLRIIESKDEEATFSNESCRDGMKRESASSIPEMSRHVNVNSDGGSQKSVSKEAKSAPSSGTSSHPIFSAKVHFAGEDARALGSMPSSKPYGSNFVSSSTKHRSAHTSRPLEVGTCSAKVSETHASPCTRSRMAESLKSVKVGEGNHEVPVCSLQLGERQGCKNGLKTSISKDVNQPIASKNLRYYPSGAECQIAGGYSSKGLFPYDLFVKLFNSKKVELLPCGLINCGNSCYANAVLQCLVFTPPFTAYLLQGLHFKSCEKNEWCFTCELESLVRKAKDGNSPVSPIRILSQLQNIGSHLGYGREEDAHEFLRYAIDTMQSVCLRETEVNAPGLAEEETTLIGLTFGGYLRSKIKCMRCGIKSERDERMMDLTVEIEGDIRTLEEALNNFTSTEILDGDNKYQCSRCKSYEKARKKLSVLEAPNVLTIALKRFQSGKFGKLNKPIQFPEVLDLAPYMSGTSDKSPVYQLYGVVVHIDIMNAAFSGHYVCYVKNVQNKWFKIDDSTVKAVELQSVLTKGAYMLLYARCSPRAPRSIRNLMIPHPRKQKSASCRSRSHSRESPDFQRTDHMNDYNHPSSYMFHRNLDEDSSSDHSSSIFSESHSCSTESSNRDSSGTEDYFDKIFGDLDKDWNNWRHSSDSDTSSSSSSHSPFFPRRSPLADSNRYASSVHKEKSNSQFDSGMNGNGSKVRSRSSKEEGKKSSDSSCLLLGSDDDCRILGCSSSCRLTNLDTLGGKGCTNSMENMKCRRSTSSRGRSD